MTMRDGGNVWERHLRGHHLEACPIYYILVIYIYSYVLIFEYITENFVEVLLFWRVSYGVVIGDKNARVTPITQLTPMKNNEE